MPRVVVVGGGPAGMAAAARLAKQRHDVVLCERADGLGGAMRPVQADGWSWDGGPATTTVPAVLRDLFRKTGRPLERELELAPVPSPRRHHFEDGTVLDLPTTGRGRQLDALVPFFGARAASGWMSVVDRQRDVWDVLRRRALEVPFDGCASLTRPEHRVLRQRLTLHRLARRELADARLRALLLHPTVLAGSDPRTTPALVGVDAYLERTFGIWRPTGGMSALVDALTARLTTRRVDVRRATAVARIDTGAGRAGGVLLTDGTELPADIVIAAIDPRAVFPMLGLPLPAWLRDTTPVRPPAVTHLGLGPGAPDLPFETIVHGRPLLVVRREEPRACTVLVRGALERDVLAELAGRGLDLRPHVTVRVDRSPAELIDASGGSPYGVAWQGARTASQQPRPGTPVNGVHCIGASAHPGAGLPLVALGAAQCAAAVTSRPVL
ncbi:MAG TPA: FAD-dependent oxidoreductase [Nocardioidaceae bacterium]|nr:FAD-dependent oxidoreductase [Nocardioidaceae bacterium]